MNHYEGFQLGLEHLIQKGYNRIACTIGRAESRNSLERKKAFEDILQTHNLPVHPEWILDETFTVDDGRTALQKLLNGNHMPDAIIMPVIMLQPAWQPKHGHKESVFQTN